MYGTCVVLTVRPERVARTFVLLCMHYEECFARHARIWRCYWWLMQYEVAISPLYILQWRWWWRLLHIIMAIASFAGCMERLLGCPWMNSAYVILLCVYLHWTVWSVFHAVWGRNFILVRSFAVRWQWRLYVDLGLLNVSNGCGIGPKPTARTFVLLCVLELEGVSY